MLRSEEWAVFLIMMFPITTYLIICPLVFLAGLVDSMAGGGGLISLPAYLLAGIPPHQAIATNKLSSSIGTTASTLRYLRHGCVNYRVAIPAAVLAILGANIGARLILLIPEKYVQYFLLFALPAVAAFVLLRKPPEVENPLDIRPERQIVLAVAISFLLGVYDGFYGPGTGTFLLLGYTGLCGLSLREASGTVKISNLSSNIMSLVIFLSKGQALVALGITAGGFCLLGHYIGSGLVLKNGGRVVKPIIMVVLGLLFCKVMVGLIK